MSRYLCKLHAVLAQSVLNAAAVKSNKFKQPQRPSADVHREVLHSQSANSLLARTPRSHHVSTAEASNLSSTRRTSSHSLSICHKLNHLHQKDRWQILSHTTVNLGRLSTDASRSKAAHHSLSGESGCGIDAQCHKLEKNMAAGTFVSRGAPRCRMHGARNSILRFLGVM